MFRFKTLKAIKDFSFNCLDLKYKKFKIEFNGLNLNTV